MIAWSSLSEFFDMRGYGIYVWGSCVVTFGALSLETWFIRRRLRRAKLLTSSDGGRE